MLPVVGHNIGRKTAELSMQDAADVHHKARVPSDGKGSAQAHFLEEFKGLTSAPLVKVPKIYLSQ